PGPRRRERPPPRAPARAVTCAPAQARLPTWTAGPAGHVRTSPRDFAQPTALTRRQAIPGFRDPPGGTGRPRLWLADRSAGGPLSALRAVPRPPHPGPGSPAPLTHRQEGHG